MHGCGYWIVWKQEEKHMDVVKPELANGKESDPKINK